VHQLTLVVGAQALLLHPTADAQEVLGRQSVQTVYQAGQHQSPQIMAAREVNRSSRKLLGMRLAHTLATKNAACLGAKALSYSQDRSIQLEQPARWPERATRDLIALTVTAACA
jgi:hypothetical protein